MVEEAVVITPAGESGIYLNGVYNLRNTNIASNAYLAYIWHYRGYPGNWQMDVRSGGNPHDFLGIESNPLVFYFPHISIQQ